MSLTRWRTRASSLLLILLHNWRSALDLWQSIHSRVSLKLFKGPGVHIDGKHHALATMRVRGLIRLLAKEEPRLITLQRDVERMEIRDIIGIEVAEVGVKLCAGNLGAWPLEAGFGEGVIDGAEVEVDALALANVVDVGWVEG